MLDFAFLLVANVFMETHSIFILECWFYSKVRMFLRWFYYLQGQGLQRLWEIVTWQLHAIQLFFIQLVVVTSIVSRLSLLALSSTSFLLPTPLKTDDIAIILEGPLPQIYLVKLLISNTVKFLHLFIFKKYIWPVMKVRLRWTGKLYPKLLG